MSPPRSCSCWWQACLCCQGRSVDWREWHCALAAPCGETHSQGPCAPSGFSTDLNNCKTQKWFALGRNKTSQELNVTLGKKNSDRNRIRHFPAVTNVIQREQGDSKWWFMYRLHQEKGLSQVNKITQTKINRTPIYSSQKKKVKILKSLSNYISLKITTLRDMVIRTAA